MAKKSRKTNIDHSALKPFFKAIANHIRLLHENRGVQDGEVNSPNHQGAQAGLINEFSFVAIHKETGDT